MLKIRTTFFLIFVFSFLSFAQSTNNLLSSTFFGGTSNDGSYYTGSNIVIDSNGEIIIAASTASTDMPTTMGVYSTVNSGNTDVIISRFSPDLQTLIASTYFGGSAIEEVRAVQIDSEGNIIIAGITESNDFPTSDNCYDNSYAGSSAAGPYGSGDVFVSKFSGNLTTLLASTLIGGTSHECCSSMAISQDGSIFITGATASSDFEITQSAYDNTKSSGGYFKVDGYIAALDNNLENLLYSTFIGGSADEFPEALEINSVNEIIITGWTSSSNFPTIEGSFDQSFNFGTYDGFVSKFSPDLSNLINSTYIGGANGWDFCYGLAVDNNDNILVCGHTGANDFPTTESAVFEDYIGTGGNNVGDDTFLSKFTPNLAQLTSSTYVGGNAWECGYGISIGSSGNVFLCGTTSSSSFPVTENALSGNYGGGTKYKGDVFLTALNSDFSQILGSTYLGNNSEDDFGQVIVSNDKIYIAGATKSAGFPVTESVYSTTKNGDFDIFISIIDENFSNVSAIEPEGEIKTGFKLLNNYPNPFNPSTQISFILETPSHVKLDIYNAIGEHIENLLNRDIGKGTHTVTWDCNSTHLKCINSGVYFAVLNSNGSFAATKMSFQK